MICLLAAVTCLCGCYATLRAWRTDSFPEYGPSEGMSSGNAVYPGGPSRNADGPGEQTGDAAQTPDQTGPREIGLFSLDFPKMVVGDAWQIASAPARWTACDWGTFGIAAGGIGAAGLLDKTVRDAAQRNRGATIDRIAEDVQLLGTGYSLGILGGFYVGGLIADDENAKSVAVDGLAASGISALTTMTIKYAVGRARPNTNQGPAHFKPFGGDLSFPSGHTTQAFAVASVVAAHYESPWVQAGAYGLAGAVGWARIEKDAHYLSDVAAGALIGTVVGRAVVALNGRGRAPGSAGLDAITPYLSTDQAGLAVVLAF
jgi:membrane-associated phospholipid phosphatase